MFIIIISKMLNVVLESYLHLRNVGIYCLHPAQKTKSTAEDKPVRRNLLYTQGLIRREKRGSCGGDMFDSLMLFPSEVLTVNRYRKVKLW